MLLLKLILGVSSILLLVKTAISKSKQKQEIYLFYYELYLVCSGFYGEMLYSKKPISEFFSKKNKNTILQGVIEDYLQNNLENSKYLEYLDIENREKVITFFNLLGKSNSESQKNDILVYKNEFLKIYSEKCIEYKKFYSLYVKVAFSLGLIVMIVVI